MSNKNKGKNIQNPNRQGMKKSGMKRRRRRFVNRGLMPRVRDHPTLVLKAKTLINQNISAVNLKQINVIPTASVFGGDILQQFKFFEQYRIARVHVHFMNLDPVNYQQGVNPLQIPIVYQVPLTTQVIPVAGQSAYLAYKNCKYFSFRSDFKRSFVPYVYTGGVGTTPLVRAPRLQTSNIDQPHYGLSFLFAKLSTTATTYTLRAVIQADIQLYTYDGNNGVAEDEHVDSHPISIFDKFLRQQEYHQQTQEIQLAPPPKPKKEKCSQSHTSSVRSIKLRTVEKNPGPTLAPVWSTRRRNNQEHRLRKGKPINRTISQSSVIRARLNRLKGLKAKILSSLGVMPSCDYLTTRIEGRKVEFFSPQGDILHVQYSSLPLQYNGCIQDAIAQLEAMSEDGDSA